MGDELTYGIETVGSARRYAATRLTIAPALRGLTRGWGTNEEVTLYLDRCQVDTPTTVVEAVWKQVLARRKAVGKVVDFGAGDGRFAWTGHFSSYVGYEIDRSRWIPSELPLNGKLVNKCAFSERLDDADLCIGNPPYVRNQDLPQGWRQRAAEILKDRTGIRLSGLANAWQYFFLLSLVSTKPEGLVALVIPYEWVSRPSAAAIRDYIRKRKWNVTVHRLLDEAFPRVLTTSSITVIEKAHTDGKWEYLEQISGEHFRRLPSVTAGRAGLLAYATAKRSKKANAFAKRGLSPGTQEVLTFTERERARLGLRIGRDVVRCVTTLRHIPASVHELDQRTFERYYCKAGKKCWLMDTSRKPSGRLLDYLSAVPPAAYQTSTCLARNEWWRFTMPDIPDLLVSSGFVKDHTKSVVNSVGACAVGSVCGIYCVAKRKRRSLAKAFRRAKLGSRIVAHSNGLRKLEINQMNTLIEKLSLS